MLGFLGKIFGSGAKEVIDGVGGVIDSLHTSDEEKMAAKMELEKLLQARESQLQESLRTELQAKERIIVAELQQGDNYTKRARPTVVYAGLGFILFNYVIAPLFMPNQTALQLPVEFWTAWGGIVATWSVGRTFEKRGAGNKATSVVTGNKQTLFD
jgi:hypothetical protein